MQVSTHRRAANGWVIAIAVASVFLATAAGVQGTERAAPRAEAQAAERNRSLITQMRWPVPIQPVDATVSASICAGVR